MSLAVAAIKIAALRSLKGRTSAGDAVFDSAVEPFDALRDQGAPVVVIYCDAGKRDVQCTFGLARLADADATAARSGLGLGSAAVYAASAFQPALGYTPVNAAGQNLAAGFTATSYPAGVQGAGGTFTPNPFNGNVQHAINGGAHTLAAPAGPCTVVVEYTNNASAGAITPSGFTKVSGAFDAVNGNKFIALIVRTSSCALLQITALQ